MSQHGDPVDPGSGAPDYGVGARGGDPAAQGWPGYGDGGSPYGYPASPEQVNPYQAYPPAYGGYASYGVQAEPHPQAVAAVILGVIGVAGLSPVGVIGLVLGLKVRRQIDAAPHRYHNRSMATVAVVLGVISLVFSLLYVAFLGIVLYGMNAY